MLTGRGARLWILFITWGLVCAVLWLGASLRPVTLPLGPVAEHMPSQLPWGAVLLAGWALVLTFVSRGGRGFELALVFRLTHALPAVLQSLIFAYWSVYWAPVRQHLPAIFFQLLFAYAFDGLLSLSLRKRWELSLGPIPVVLSTNLFAQFAPALLDASLVMISLALVSKALIRVNGKHVFNPSAFGICIVGLFWVAARLPPAGDVSTQLNLAPNMAELLLLLGVVVQLRVKTVLLTAFAGLGLMLSHVVTGFSHFAVTWPAVLIVITLLATDPATTPMSGPGRALGGFALGFFMPIAGGLAAALTGGWDFYGKVMLIPLLNLLAPRFDRWAARLPGKAALDFKYTPLHVMAWLGLAALSIGSPKPQEREWEWHRLSRTPLIVFNDDGSVSCARNAVFCEPFSVVEEGRRWLAAPEGRF